MSKKTITLIEDDVDGSTVLLTAQSEELLRAEASALWTEFEKYPNQNFNRPTDISTTEVGEDGEVGCHFNVCYPLNIAGEVVADWLRENGKNFGRSTTGFTFSYS